QARRADPRESRRRGRRRPGPVRYRLRTSQARRFRQGRRPEQVRGDGHLHLPGDRLEPRPGRSTLRLARPYQGPGVQPAPPGHDYRPRPLASVMDTRAAWRLQLERQVTHWDVASLALTDPTDF